MWKNVFLESCILSALIFGGFYLNATLLKDELYSNNDRTRSSLSHISGYGLPLESPQHVSGEKSKLAPLSHISGLATSTPQ